MERLDRYLESVRKHLPWDRQDDVVAELRANLESQLEDKESDLGRPLTEAEAATWIRQLGSPINVAGKYKPQQYLIGPAFFPTYWYVLRIVLLWATAIYLVARSVEIVSGSPTWSSIAFTVFAIPNLLMVSAAWVTLVFAVIEFVTARNATMRQKFADKFEQMDDHLPGFNDQPGQLPAKKKLHSLATAIAEVVVYFVLAVWLLLIPQYPVVLLGPGVVFLKALPFTFTPVVTQWFWCVVALNMVQFLWKGYDLWSGRWRNPNPLLQRIAFKVFGLIPVAVLLSAPDHVYALLRDPASNQAKYGAMVNVGNQSVYRGMLVICAILVLQLGYDAFVLWQKTYRNRIAAH
jgi:hypothetical protein